MWSQVVRSSIKACVPFKRPLRSVVRKLRPYAVADPDNDDLALRQGLEIIRRARRAGSGLGRVLEVGTGWIPTIPCLFHAAGADEIIMTDMEALLDERTRAAAAAFVAAGAGRVARHLGMSVEAVQANLRRPLNSTYLCPFDPSQVAPASVDLVYSRTVLEHVPPKTLRTLLRDLRTRQVPGGLSIHFIDNSDHYQHRDGRLSRVNFLRYPDWLWRVSQWEGQAYQNRLRHSDYIRLFEEAGYELLDVEGVPDAGCLDDLRSMTLAPRFTRYQPADLAVLSTLIVARTS